MSGPNNNFERVRTKFVRKSDPKLDLKAVHDDVTTNGPHFEHDLTAKTFEFLLQTFQDLSWYNCAQAVKI